MTAVLDRLLPEHVVRTRRDTTVAAPPAAVWEAIRGVTPGEMPLTRALTGIRALPARVLGSRGGGRVDDPERPLVDQFVASGFTVLHEDPPRTLAVGAVGTPWRLSGADARPPRGEEDFSAFSRPGYVRMAMAFELNPEGDGTRLATETRVQPTDPGSAAAFRRYWRIIRPGSALIRLDLLHAIRRRAEHTEPGAGVHDGRGG